MKYINTKWLETSLNHNIEMQGLLHLSKTQSKRFRLQLQ